MTRSYPLLGIGLLLVTIAVLPLAAAMSWPLVGSFDIGFNWGFGLILIGGLCIIAAFPAGRALVGKIPLAGRWFATGGITLGIVLLLVASFVNPGGLLNFSGSAAEPGSFTAAPGAVTTAPAGHVAFDKSLYMSTSKVSASVADYYTHLTSLSGTVYIYQTTDVATGQPFTDKAMLEGSATPLYTVTLTSGAATQDGIQVQTIGCYIDVRVHVSGYYDDIERNVFVCADKNTNGYNTVSPPTWYLAKIGTPTLTDSASSLTCSAGSQCTYAVKVSNSVANSELRNVAVSFTGLVNATIDSVDTGSPCTMTTVSGTTYVVLNSKIGSVGEGVCLIKTTRAGGSADGQYKLIADDQWNVAGAQTWATNSGFDASDATAAKTVSYA